MEYEVIRSCRRTLGIQIKEGRIIVRAPLNLSDSQIEKIVEAHENWILKQLQKSRPPLPEADEGQLKDWEKQAEKYLPEKVRYYSDLMGLRPASVKINRARTRLGSCSSQGRIHFSCRLMQYPPEAIDYVVVHELAHLKHMDHGKEFYRLIETYLPDYRERKKLLK